MRGLAALVPVGMALLAACGLADRPHAGLEAPAWHWQLPPGFEPPVVPADNPMTAAGVELGRHLFHDRRLSGDGSMACATCHQQALAFTDGRARAVGMTGERHPRSAPSLANVAWAPVLTWANPLLTHLEEQAVVPMFSDAPVEMGLAGQEARLLERLRTDTTYARLFRQAWPDREDPVTLQGITQALAQFQRTLVSGYSAWDRYERYGDREAVTESEMRGARLFRSERLGCAACHAGPTLTVASASEAAPGPDRPYFNTGLYNIGGTGGYPRDNTGLAEFSGDPADMGRFRPPTLRNVAVTAPYMHDGSIATLEGVLDHYAAGGRTIASGPRAGRGHANPNKDPRVGGFTLSLRERADVLAYLRSLTDSTFLTDPRFGSPWPADSAS